MLFRSTGGVGQIMALTGSTLPFPWTAAQRAAAGDPRASVEERYAGRADYLARVRAVAEDLVARRFAIAEDVEVFVAHAAERWEALAAREGDRS